MAALSFVREHGMEADQARTKVRSLLERFAGGYPRLKIKVKWNRQGDGGTCRGRGFDGTFTVSETTVLIQIKLSLIGRPFAGRIEEGMGRKLAETFPG